jgi:hypothetical protein
MPEMQKKSPSGGRVFSYINLFFPIFSQIALHLQEKRAIL